jgi:hypothetical protein
MKIGANPSTAARPIGPMPMKKDIGFLTAVYSGTSPKFTQRAMAVDVKFSGKAVAGGDLASFMKVTLPANQGIRPPTPPPPQNISVSFKSGDSALTQAKKLEAALNAQAHGYKISRTGSEVRVQMMLME